MTVNLTTPPGHVIKPENIDLSKFNDRPFLLINHDWNELNIGKASKINIDDSGLHFTPEFHDLTKSSIKMHGLYNKGLLTAQPGGFLTFDEEGNITKFILHEISLCK